MKEDGKVRKGALGRERVYIKVWTHACALEKFHGVDAGDESVRLVPVKFVYRSLGFILFLVAKQSLFSGGSRLYDK